MNEQQAVVDPGTVEKRQNHSQRHKPAFNIPDPNPIRGSNMIIELNAEMSRLLCDVLEDTELEESESPVYALLKGMRRYHGQITEIKKARWQAAHGNGNGG